MLTLSLLLLGCRSFYGRGAPVTAVPGAPVAVTPGSPVVVAPGLPAANPLGPPLANTAPGPVIVPGAPTLSGPPVSGPPVRGGVAPVLPSQATAAPLFPGLPPAPANPWARGPAPMPMSAATLVLTPQSMVAPVGSDVVLLATATDGRGQPLTGHRVEWMLSPDSVGQLITLDRKTAGRQASQRIPTKVDNNFAVGTTAARPTTLTRGTPTQVDDVIVRQGQAWISVSSATDGASYVTALAPNLPAWDRRKQTSLIYWIDAQFSFPAPVIGPVGSRQVLTTIVTRASDGSPIEGYRVRYAITGGPAAGFTGSSAPEIEVATDAEGRAVVEVFQTEAARGENSVQVDVVRPPGFAGSGDRRLTIGRGTTMISWTAPEIDVRLRGPQEAEVGSTATYRVEVVNPGDGSLADVVLTNRVPSGLRYQKSSVAADSSGGSLRWRLGPLGPGQAQTIDVDYEVTRPTTIQNCVTVSASPGLTAKACANTQALLAPLQLHVTGPPTARVGQQITFAIAITNPGATAATGLILKDTFGAGLEHEVATSPIERELGTLGPGETRDDLAVTFRVTQAGRICHRVELRGKGLRSVQQTVCVDVALATGPPPAAGGQEPSLAEPVQGSLRVDKRGPATARVGDKLIFELVVTNSGDIPLTNVRISDDYDLPLRPQRVSEGFQYRDEKLSWTVAQLPPGETRTFQVEAVCDRAGRACSRATVSADGGVLLADEACLQIEPADPAADDAESRPARPPQIPGNGAAAQPPSPGGAPAANLELKIADLRDEVAVGQTVTYEVTITNPRDTSERNVELVLNVPAGMTPVATGTVAPSKATIVGRRVRFTPVAEIRPKETLIYRIPVRADRPGRFVVEAKAISANQRKPLLSTEETNIYAEEN